MVVLLVVFLEANCRVSRIQASKYMRLSNEMPCLIDANAQSTAHFAGIEAAIAYLSAPVEVKAQVDKSAYLQTLGCRLQERPCISYHW